MRGIRLTSRGKFLFIKVPAYSAFSGITVLAMIVADNIAGIGC